MCRWLLWLSTDKSSFAHLVTRCDVAGLGFDAHLKGQNETTNDLIQPPLPCALSMGKRGRRKGWQRVFLHFKKWLYSSWLIQRQKHWQPECQSLSWNHQALREPSAKLSPVCTRWHCSSLSMEMPRTDPSGNEQNFPFASFNLTRIYKPLQMDVSILFHLWICANMLIHTVNFTVNAKFRITQPDTNS